MPGKDGTGPQGKGMGKGQGIGPGGECVCPNCGGTSPHSKGVPCSDCKCPQCGTAMIRKD